MSAKFSQVFFLLLSSALLPCFALDKKEVENIIDKKLNSFEDLLVARYNLIRRCEKPVVSNGHSECKQGKNAKKKGDLPPGSFCWVVCDIGYISTPGNHTTRCLEGGFWSNQLNCEIPLVLVSGGTVDSADTTTASLELVSPLPSQGCDSYFFPNLPGNPNERKLHNLMYMSPNNKKIVACNGLSPHPKTTCVSWTPGDASWKEDYEPSGSGGGDSTLNWMKQFEGLGMDMSAFGGKKNSGGMGRKKSYRPTGDFKLGTDPLYKPLAKVARYASSSVKVDDKIMIVGGMVNTKPEHKPVDVILVIEGGSKDWKHIKSGHGNAMRLSKPRAFFCIVPGFNNSNSFFSIGGFSGDKNKMEKSGEILSFSSFSSNGIYTSSRISHSSMTDMPEPRSGHGCTGLPNSQQLIVSGGSQDEESPVLRSSILYTGDLDGGKWDQTGPMKEARFGHALVTIAGRVFAIGGNQRHPDKVSDTIEEFNIDKNTWNYIHMKMKTPRTDFGYTLVPHSIFPGCTVDETPKNQE